MLWKSAILLSCALWAAANGTVDIPPPNPPPSPANVTTTELPTTPKPNTTTTTTTSTTTPKSTTTTSKPTTSSTTSSPITTPITSTPSPPTTPKPDDKPSINEYIGNVTGTDRVCFMAKMAIQVEFNSTKNSTIILNVPKTVDYKTNCSSQKDQETLSIAWDKNQTVFFTFFKNNSKYEIQSIALNLNLPGINQTINLVHKNPEFSVSEKLSYLCSKDQALNLTAANDNSTIGKIHLSHLQYQAFMNTSDTDYASVWNCDGTNTSDVVPVVVGCVLAILVVLALVGYLFGRRRCQARGYLSM